jgi:hypothetical protein
VFIEGKTLVVRDFWKICKGFSLQRSQVLVNYGLPSGDSGKKVGAWLIESITKSTCSRALKLA